MNGDEHTVTGPTARIPRRLWTAAAIVVVVVAAAGWWLFRPGALPPVADAMGFEVPDEQPRLASYLVHNTRPIELISVRPASPPAEGTTVTIVACRWHDPLDAFATADGPLDDHCAETRELEGLRLEPYDSVRGRDWDVVAAIALGDQLSYVTEGFVVEYRDGIRRGRQTTGPEFHAYRPGHEPFE